MLKEFGDTLKVEDYNMCIEFMNNFVNCPNAENVISSFVYLSSLLYTYSRLKISKEDLYIFSYDKKTLDLNTLKNVPFRYSALSKIEIEKQSSQFAMLYNMYCNVYGESEDVRLHSDHFCGIRNSLAHEPYTFRKGYGIKAYSINRFPSPEFVENITMHVLGSNIGYNYMAEVIKFFKGKYPKGYEKKEETKDIFGWNLSWDESEFTI